MDVRNEDTDVMRSTRNGVMSGVSNQKTKEKKEPDEWGKQQLNNNQPSSRSRHRTDGKMPREGISSDADAARGAV